MPDTQKTIFAASNPRIRQPPKTTRAPLAPEKRKQQQEESEKTQSEIQDAVQGWMQDIYAKADELALRFEKTPRFFLDTLFQGGARMVNRQDKVNAYNAFKSEKAAECRENGEAKRVPVLHRDYHEEYLALTESEKADLVQRFTESRGQTQLRRATPRARVQDFSNTMRNMQMLFQGLTNRVGVEGLFLIVRNNNDFHTQPHWYFTCPELERYMPIAVGRRWDTAQVGAKVEAFAVAGCDTINLLRTAPQKAAFAKTEIREMILKKLIDITGNPNAVMSYVNHEEDIVFKYGVELIGWTPDKWCNPSELTSSLPVLRKLLNALKSGECGFEKLSPRELATRKREYEEDIAAGIIVGKQRNPRSDIGQKHKRKRDNVEAEDSDTPGGDDEEQDETSVQPTPAESAAYSVEEPNDAAPVAAPPAKRRRTAKTLTAAAANAAKPTKKKPAAKASARPRAKGRENKGGREDDTTRAALQRLKRGAGPGSTAGRAFKSRAIITDDDEDPAAAASSSQIEAAQIAATATAAPAHA